MLFTTLHTVTEIMKEKDLRYFTVKDKDGSKLYELTSGDHTASTAVNRLEDFFTTVEGDWCWIQIRGKEGKAIRAGGDNSTGFFDYKVKLSGETESKKVGGIGTVERSLMEEISGLNLKIKEMEYKNDLKTIRDDFNKKIEGLQNADPLEKYAPLIGMVFQKLGWGALPAASPINGVEETAPTVDQNKQTCIKAVNRLRKADPQFHIHITMLAELAEKSPLIYAGAIEKLKSL